VTFVPIQNRHPKAVLIGQSFVAFEPIIDVMNSLAEPLGLQSGMDPPERIRAGRRLS
jgi:hypothetical protein